jgi:hypothetical protein
MQQLSQLQFHAQNKAETENIDLTSEEPSMLALFTNTSKLLELENRIRYIEIERVILSTAHSNLSGEMKQVIKATLAQSKEINVMHTEMGSIYGTRCSKTSISTSCPIVDRSHPDPHTQNSETIHDNSDYKSHPTILPIEINKRQQKSRSTIPAFNSYGLKRTRFYVRS